MATRWCHVVGGVEAPHPGPDTSSDSTAICCVVDAGFGMHVYGDYDTLDAYLAHHSRNGVSADVLVVRTLAVWLDRRVNVYLDDEQTRTFTRHV
jgi:hypothetical protein